MQIKEVKILKAMNASKLPDCDYVINPYVGCTHNCAYCFARYMKFFTGHKEDWGEFIDVKTNIGWALEDQLKRASRNSYYPKGKVLLSSVTDPYQPIEEKYKLTKKCLELLAHYDWETAVLTKSSLVLRDLKILKKFKKVEVGLSIGTLNSNNSKLFEPGSSQISERISTLEELTKNGIKTYAFIAPVFPYLTDLEKMFKFFSNRVDKIYVETLNTRTVNWTGVRRVLKENFPELLPKYENIFFSPEREIYLNELDKKVEELGRTYNIETKTYIHE